MKMACVTRSEQTKASETGRDWLASFMGSDSRRNRIVVVVVVALLLLLSVAAVAYYNTIHVPASTKQKTSRRLVAPPTPAPTLTPTNTLQQISPNYIKPPSCVGVICPPGEVCNAADGKCGPRKCTDHVDCEAEQFCEQEKKICQCKPGYYRNPYGTGA